MIRSIVNLIRAFIQWIWRFITQPWIRFTIFGIIISVALIIVIATGTAFITVYSGIISLIFVFGILSIWIPVLRGFLVSTLIVGALFYFGNSIIIDKIVPTVNQKLSATFSNYKEWRETKKLLINNKLAGDTIQMKKEMMVSEVVKGTFGKIIEDSIIYDELGNPLVPAIKLLKGQRIMSLGLESKKQVDGSEGMAFVLIANSHGDFVKSRSGLVPIRKIEWEGQLKYPPPPSADDKKPTKKISSEIISISFSDTTDGVVDIPVPEQFHDKDVVIIATGKISYPFLGGSKKIRRESAPVATGIYKPTMAQQMLSAPLKGGNFGKLVAIIDGNYYPVGAKSEPIHIGRKLALTLNVPPPSAKGWSKKKVWKNTLGTARIFFREY